VGRRALDLEKIFGNFLPTVTYLQLPIRVCFSSTVGRLSSCWARKLSSSSHHME